MLLQVHPAGPDLSDPQENLPGWRSAFLFRAKAICFQARRMWQDALRPDLRCLPRGETHRAAPVIAEWRSELWTENTTPQELRLQLGKVQNLRVAVRALHGLEIPAGAVFSFWRQLGRTTRWKGYTIGRELREGCLIPMRGGGLCQLSGALYNAGLEAGLEIVERHAHSSPGASSLAKLGRDATVFWNYVDLRLRGDTPWRLEAELTREHLVIRIRAAERPARRKDADGVLTLTARTGTQQPNSCATCGIEDCFRHRPATDGGAGIERQAVIVDEWWPEWQACLDGSDFRSALLCRPLDGERFRKPNYQWKSGAFGAVANATIITLRRARAVRRLREQGAARQRELLAWDGRLARALAGKLKAEHTHLLVSQNLLPFLWREGVLGGRTFDVFMVRLPLAELQRELDRAAALHPDSGTCADFRAPIDLVEAESVALAAAIRWITPHSRIAELGGARSLRLPWKIKPGAPPRREGRTIVFPASTLCRKGAYELREAARALDLEVICLGGFLEGADFWSGVRMAQPAPGDWLAGIRAVVLPAFVEHRPRRLLQAIEAGVPVIASTACGLRGLPGVTEVPAGNTDELMAALRTVLADPVAAASKS